MRCLRTVFSDDRWAESKSKNVGNREKEKVIKKERERKREVKKLRDMEEDKQETG